MKPQDAVRLVGAHGEDVVRSLLVHSVRDSETIPGLLLGETSLTDLTCFRTEQQCSRAAKMVFSRLGQQSSFLRKESWVSSQRLRRDDARRAFTRRGTSGHIERCRTAGIVAPTIRQSNFSPESTEKPGPVFRGCNQYVVGL